MNLQLQILPVSLLDDYLSKTVGLNLAAQINLLQEAEVSTPDFSFYTSVASVYSSKIEGEDIELDSFIRHKRFGVEFKPDYTQKVDDLYAAYCFAQQHNLNRQNLETAHSFLSDHFLSVQYHGKVRNQVMYVITPDGKIEYVAASPYEVGNELKKLFQDIETLLSVKLSMEEAFYFAAMIHLVFVKIHPFVDGNGRTARLLEKWFLAQRIGEKAWFLQSEKMYYKQHKQYYTNLRALGLEYDELNYQQSLPFLLMLTQSFKSDED